MHWNGSIEDSDVEQAQRRCGRHGWGRWVVDKVANDVHDLGVVSGTSEGGCGVWDGGICFGILF